MLGLLTSSNESPKNRKAVQLFRLNVQRCNDASKRDCIEVPGCGRVQVSGSCLMYIFSSQGFEVQGILCGVNCRRVCNGIKKDELWAHNCMHISMQ